MKWDLLSLRNLRRIILFVDTQLTGTMLLNEAENDDLDEQVRIHLEDLDEMDRHHLNEVLRPTHTHCYDLLEFFL